MGERRILRLIHKHVEHVGEARVRAGLFAEEYVIQEYEIVSAALLLQDPTLVEVEAHPLGSRLYRLAPSPWRPYCRWHNGPLDRPDDPAKRIYCNLPAEDYCSKHRRSPRAIYEKCMTLRGELALEACRAVDRIAPTEYVVYLTDFGGGKPKVGVTRLFRARERIAEQPHHTATFLLITDSAVEARKAEMRISGAGLAQELASRSGYTRRGLGESASRLRFWAERIARALGINWNGVIFRVRPPAGFEEYRLVRAQRVTAPFRVVGFWGGYLYLESEEGEKWAIRAREIQHTDALTLL